MADLNKQLFQELASIIQNHAANSTPSEHNIFQYIMNTGPDFTWKLPSGAMTDPKSLSDKGNKQSTFSHIIDYLSRPLYAAVNPIKEQLASINENAKNGFQLSDLKNAIPSAGLLNEIVHPSATWKGLSGQEKTTTRDITQQLPLPDVLKKGVGGFALNLAGDIALDPTTAIGPGAVKGLFKGVKAVTALPEAAKVTEAAKAAEQASTVLPAAGKPTMSPLATSLADAIKGRTAPTSLEALRSGKNVPFLAPYLNTSFDALGKTAPVKAAVLLGRAQKAAQDAPAVSMALDQTTRTAATAAHALSPMGANQVIKSTIVDAKTILKGTDASREALKAYTSLSRDILGKSEGPAQQAVRKHSRLLDAVVSGVNKGKHSDKYGRMPAQNILKTWPKYNSSVTAAINGALDEPVRLLKPGETVSEKAVTHGLMARFFTFWGHKDLRPQALDAEQSAIANAEAGMRAWDNAFKGHSAEEIMQAWEVAAERKPPGLASAKEVALADVIKGGLENYFKSSGINSASATANSVALRSGMTMNALNTTLKRYGLENMFTNEGAYSKGTDWLNSWEKHQFKNPNELKKFIFVTQKAAEQLSKEYGFVDDLAARFGSTTKTAGSVAVDHPRLKGYYFHSDMADQVSLAIGRMHDFYSPNSPVTKFIASGMSVWKGSVTKYAPRHHIANVIGDSFLMWISGINDPQVFTKAAKVLWSQKGMYKDLESVQNLIGRDAVKNAMTKPGTVIAKNKSGMTLTADQIYIMMHSHGLLQGVSAIEDIIKPGLPGGLKPFGGRVSNKIGKLAETREHSVKIAHFIGAFEKSRGKDLTKIVDEVSHEVRKWHPDGLDLTSLEQKIRLVIPFYSWLRKSTPLLIEGAVMRPQKAFLIPAKLQYNLQQSLGIQGTSLSNPFPSDQLFPGWIQEKGIGPLGMTGMTGLAGRIAGLGRQGTDSETGKPIGGYTVAGPSNPLQDLFGQFGGFTPTGIKQGVLSSVNPMFRVPYELLSGKQAFSDAPTPGGTDYLTQQIPVVSNLSRMTNTNVFGQPTARGAREGTGLQGEASLNWLLDAGIVGTGPYIKQAKFEKIPGLTADNKKYREFANQIGFPINSKGKIPDWIKQMYAQRQGG